MSFVRLGENLEQTHSDCTTLKLPKTKYHEPTPNMGHRRNALPWGVSYASEAHVTHVSGVCRTSQD